MTIKCILNAEDQQKHYPESYLVNGVRRANPETPERIGLLLDGANKAGMEIVAPENYGIEPIARVHSEKYLTFLEHSFKRWSYIEGAASEITPNIHPTNRDGEYPQSVVAQAGYHMMDAACPITKETWNSSLWSAWSAVHAAELVINGERAAYALCRPPGHHAGPDIAGGFCYLNNTAIAAEHLRRHYSTVAILDVDLHHGNGTQMIFYDRNDILTISIHADPKRFYPFFWGYASEQGEGKGQGYNLNLPIARGSKDQIFLEALDKALDRLNDFAPDALVIALGLDAYEGDPIAGLSISSEGFRMIGEKIAAKAALPTVMVQEGGYPCKELGDNLATFMDGFKSGSNMK